MSSYFFSRLSCSPLRLQHLSQALDSEAVNKNSMSLFLPYLNLFEEEPV